MLQEEKTQNTSSAHIQELQSNSTLILTTYIGYGHIIKILVINDEIAQLR